MNSWRPSYSAEIIPQQIGSETLLLDGKGNTVHVLNATALAIWNCCDGSHTAEQIEDALREQFEISADVTLTQDVLNTLTLFRQKGLVT